MYKLYVYEEAAKGSVLFLNRAILKRALMIYERIGERANCHNTDSPTVLQYNSQLSCGWAWAAFPERRATELTSTHTERAHMLQDNYVGQALIFSCVLTL